MKPVTISYCCTCSFLLLWFLYGIYSFVQRLEDNKCEMTYMFEYPQYIKVELGGNVSAEFPDYHLHVYGEGEQAERYRNGLFEGLPVLFIPGNSGSFKQVRSLGSVAYRKAIDSKKGVKLDFFAIDFNEELSALYGGILYKQVKFTKEAINKVTSLYKKKDVSIVLIGHSMGGIVAKAVVDKFSHVRTIITLATPHQHPVVALDGYMVEFYRTVQRNWLEAKLNKQITLASIGGADRDFQVRSGLTIASNDSISVLTTEIPGAWVTVDHLCIVWCKQVVTVVVRSLFDLVDPFTGNWIKDFSRRHEVLSYHLKKRYSGKSIRSIENTKSVSFDPDGRWREVIASQFVGMIDKEEPINTFIMIPLIDNPHRDRLTAIGTGLPANWVFGCVATAFRKSVRFCERGDNLSDQTVFLPYTDNAPKRKQIYLDLGRLRLDGYTHVVLNIPKTHSKGSILFDVHRSTDRNHPAWPISGLISRPESLRISAETLSRNITLPGFSETWQSLAVTVKGISNCLSSEKSTLIRKVVPWSHENQFYWINNTVEVHLHKPKALQDEHHGPAHIQVLNPNQCNFEISINYSWAGIWTQLARFYFPFVLPIVTAIYLYSLSYQVNHKASKSRVPNVISCILNIPILKTVMCIEGITYLIRLLEARLPETLPIPKSDITQLHSHALSFPFMYAVLGAVAWAFALILAILFLFFITAGGHVLQSFVIRYLRTYLGVSSILAELLAMGFAKLPIIISVALIAFAASTCGSFALFIGLIICLLKLFSYFEDELESMLNEEEQEDNFDDFRVNTTISLLWLCTVLLSLPTFVVWIRSPRLSLVYDPFLITSVIWSFFGMIVLHKSEEDRQRQWFTYRLLGCALVVVAALTIFFGLLSLYRVQYFTTAAIVMYASKQWV